MDVLEQVPATIISDDILNGNNHCSEKKEIWMSSSIMHCAIPYSVYFLYTLRNGRTGNKYI